MKNEDTYVGIEPGSAFFRAIVVRPALHAPDGFEVAAWARVPSSGVRRGVVVEVSEASRAVNNLRSELEMQLGAKVSEALVAVSGAHVASIPSKGLVAVARADGEIGEEDVRRAQEAAQAVAIGANRDLLHVLERSYAVDNEAGVRDPRGMRGVRLELEALIIAAASSHVRALEEVFGAAGITPVSFIASPIAAARGILTPRQRELGTLLLDVGAGTTDFAVFEEGRCLHAGVIPIGGAHITNDIAIGLRLPVDIAEQVKHAHGLAVAKAAGKREMIELSSDAPGDSFTKKQLGEIIEARLTEIFDLIAKELASIGRERLLPGGVVLAGGIAQMPLGTELARTRLKLPAAIGMPILTSGPKEVRGDSSFATALGMVMLALEEERLKPASNSFSGIPRLPRKMKNFFRSLLP